MNEQNQAPGLGGSLTNKEIRGIAAARGGGRFLKLLLLSLLVFFVQFTFTVLVPMDAGWQYLLASAGYVLYYPLMVGCYGAFYSCYREGKVPLEGLLACYRAPARLKAALLLGLVTRAVGAVVNVGMLALDRLLPQPQQAMYAVLLSLPLMLVSLYLNCRLFAAPYLLARGGAKSAGALLKESFGLTRGRVHRLVAMYLSFAGWVLLAVLAGTLVMTLTGPEAGTTLPMLAMGLVLTVAMGRIELSLAGLASAFMPVE